MTLMRYVCTCTCTCTCMHIIFNVINFTLYLKGGLLYQGLKHQAVGYSKLFTGGMWKTTILLWIIWYIFSALCLQFLQF